MLYAPGNPDNLDRVFRQSGAKVFSNRVLAREHPANGDYRSNLCEARSSVATVLLMDGKTAEGLKQFRQVIADCERLSAEFPHDPAHRRNAAASLIQARSTSATLHAWATQPRAP